VPAEFAGEFETHITVQLGALQSNASVRDWGLRHGLKSLHIVLDRGDTVSQPMLTRRGQGVLSRELARALELSDELSRDGFVVVRIKIEAMPCNQDIPQSDADAESHSPTLYFEHHIKLAIDANTDLSALVALVQRHSANLSRNAFKMRSDGQEERFVTQRCRSVGRATARLRLDALLSALATDGYQVLRIEEEFVVHDSNIAIDAGWLEP
jgi:hypothetical protein